MFRSCALIALLVATPALAQQQQAGNEASTNTEETFQALIDQCDDTDALMLRARIRLQLPRTTPEAAAQSQEMLDQAFATCGGGDVEAAKTQLAEALEIAEAGVAETFEAEEAAAAEEATATAAETTEDAAAETAEKPWWQFW
ncbi:MAG: hypothetical protein AAFS07_13480 [Pseudomonadota bacterium]